MSTSITPMNLGELFDRIFKTIGRTIGRNTLIGAVIFIPAIIILGLVMHTFVGHILDVLPGLPEDGPEDFSFVFQFKYDLLLLFAAIFIFIAASILAELCMMAVASREMLGQDTPWNDTLQHMAGMPWLRAFLISIMKTLAYMGLMLVPFTLLLVRNALVIPLIVLLVLAGVCALIFLAVRWAYTLPVIATEDTPVIDTFRRSWRLVEGIWWRTFGLIILFGLVSSFAVSLITTPLGFIVMWDFWAKYFEFIGQSLAAESEFEPMQVMNMFSSFGLAYGIIIGISTFLTTVVEAVYLTVLYIDARARNNEFPPEEPPESAIPEPV